MNPGWNHKLVYLQKQNCPKCAWRTVAKVRTSAVGAWNFRIGAPRTGKWFWRVYANKSTGFVKAWSRVYVSYRL